MLAAVAACVNLLIVATRDNPPSPGTNGPLHLLMEALHDLHDATEVRQ